MVSKSKYIVMLFLFFGYFYAQAQNNILKPKLVINKTEIDLCINDNKGFILSIDLGEKINKEDSLILFEVVIAYKKELVSWDGIVYTATTLSEQMDYKPEKPNVWEEGVGGEYGIISIAGTNITRPIYSNSTSILVAIPGKIIADTPNVADFFIVETFFNEEFKRDYNIGRSDTIETITLPKNLPERIINLTSDANTYKIEAIEESVTIPLKLDINNKRYLQSWNTDIMLTDAENVEIESYEFNNDIFDCDITNVSNEKISFFTIIKDIENFTGNEQLCLLKLKRKNKEQSNQMLIAEISNINENSCAMNTKSLELDIECDFITGISISDDKMIDVVYNNISKTLLINTAELIRELTIYNIMGNEVLVKENIDDGRILDLNELASGFYIIKLEFSNNNIKAKKLIIN